MALRKLGFNDMIGKGWDSAPQESFCWQRFYENGATTDRETNQFWWVPTVWEIHGHAWNWDAHKRRPDGKFLKFPPSGQKTEGTVVTRLLCLATLFANEDGDKAEELIKVAKAMNNGKIVI